MAMNWKRYLLIQQHQKYNDSRRFVNLSLPKGNFMGKVWGGFKEFSYHTGVGMQEGFSGKNRGPAYTDVGSYGRIFGRSIINSFAVAMDIMGSCMTGAGSIGEHAGFGMAATVVGAFPGAVVMAGSATSIIAGAEMIGIGAILHRNGSNLNQVEVAKGKGLNIAEGNNNYPKFPNI